mmetsp:Transcript_33955/g.39548  ORF Transcript_33955/g.39548 Transcript_33955/m.39548 type:complete len:233 (-) Transcript_33955:443-1141(-)
MAMGAGDRREAARAGQRVSADVDGLQALPLLGTRPQNLHVCASQRRVLEATVPARAAAMEYIILARRDVHRLRSRQRRCRGRRECCEERAKLTQVLGSGAGRVGYGKFTLARHNLPGHNRHLLCDVNLPALVGIRAAPKQRLDAQQRVTKMVETALPKHILPGSFSVGCHPEVVLFHFWRRCRRSGRTARSGENVRRDGGFEARLPLSNCSIRRTRDRRCRGGWGDGGRDLV